MPGTYDDIKKYFNGDEMAATVFMNKYAIRDGDKIELPNELIDRVAKAVASVEEEPDKWYKKFKKIMDGFKYFVPAGRILYGAGRENVRVSLFNCMYLPIEEDSLEGILDAAKKLARAFSRGFGVGLDISVLRYNGAPVNNAAERSTGSVSFMDLYSIVTGTVGQCLHGRARILTSDGWKSIKNIKIGDKVWTDKGWKKVSFVFTPKSTKLYKLRTKRGYEIIASAEHKFVDEKLNLKPLADFRPGDSIVLIRGREYGGKYAKLNPPKYKRSTYNNSNRLKEISYPEVLDEDLAYFIGFMMGNGCVYENRKSCQVSFATYLNYEEIANKIISILKEKFDIDTTYYVSEDDHTLRIDIGSKLLCAFLKQNGLLKHRSYDIYVPEKVWYSPPSVVSAFLAGFFDADGTIGVHNGRIKKGYTFMSVSRKFIEDCQRLLIGLGIVSRIHIYKRKNPKWRTLYSLSITGNTSTVRAIETVGKYSIKLQGVKTSYRDNVKSPYTARQLNITSKLVGSRDITMTLGTLERIKKEQNLNVNSDIFIDTIETIEEYGNDIAYDIEVEDTHKFMADGFYVSNSQRRGALIITIDSSHPDIFDFLDKKAVPDMHTKELIRDFEYAGFSKELIDQIAKVLVRHQVRYANISVKVDDELMRAVKEDDYYTLQFGDYKKKIKARELFHKLAQRAWESAEPGVIFWNTAQRFSNSDVYEGKFKVGGLNPCAEQILPPYGVCNLGSINLSSFVKNPFTDEAYLDKDSLKEVIGIAVRFLDNVNDLALKLGTIPFKETEYLVKNERRIGLGIMGLADMLIKMGYKYNTKKARNFMAEVMEFFRDSAYKASIELAKEKGAFPVFDPDKHMKSGFIQTLPEEIRKNIYDYGIRNMAILSVAPTGSISILARTSSGIEPLFFLEYERYSPSLGKVFKTEHPLVAEYHRLYPDKELPDTFIVAHQIDPEDRVKMQAVIGQYVDAAMSSTVNLPESATVEDVEKIYMLAYDLGLKGITVYREGSRTPIVAEKKEEKKKEERKEEDVLKLRKRKRKRPAVLSGKTYKIKYKNSNYYVTINSDDGKPLEVFAQSSDMTEQEWWGALSRLISAVLRRVAADEDVMFLANQLLKIKEVQGTGSFYKGEYIPSKPGVVGLALKWFLEGKDPDEKPKVEVSPVLTVSPQLDKKALKQVASELDLNKAEICPVCGNRTLITGEEAKAFGCSSFCVSCGYSKCD